MNSKNNENNLNLNRSITIQHASQEFPYVLAVLLNEYIYEDNPLVKLWSICDFFELTLRLYVITSLATAMIFDPKLSDEIRKIISEDIECPTLGRWCNMARLIIEHKKKKQKKEQETSISNQFSLIMKKAIMPHLIGKEGKGVEHAVLNLRNQLAHGGGITREVAQKLLTVWEERFEAVVQEMQPLASLQLVVKKETQYYYLKGPIVDGIPANITDKTIKQNTGDEEDYKQVWMVEMQQGNHIFIPLWPLSFYGSSKEQGEIVDNTQNIYVRCGEMQLVYTPVGSKISCQTTVSGAYYQAFEELFMVDDKSVHKTVFSIRGFEADLRKEAKELIGRIKEIERIMSNVQKYRSGYFWITGNAGMGKSFLMAKITTDLIAQGNKNILVLPYRFRKNDDRCSSRVFFKYCLERIYFWQNKMDRIPQDKNPLDLLKELIHDLPKGKRIIFILDGLDEMPEHDLDFIRQLLSLRDSQVLWLLFSRELKELSSSADIVNVFPEGLPSMTTEDIRAIILEKMGPLSKQILRHDQDNDKTSQDQEKVINPFIEQVVENSNGLPLYVKYVIGDILSRKIRVFDGSQILPPSLEEYYKTLFDSQGIGITYSLVSPLLALLAVQKEAMTKHALEEYFIKLRQLPKNNQTVMDSTLSMIATMIKRVQTKNKAIGYNLYHTSLYRYMRNSKEHNFLLNMAVENLCVLIPIRSKENLIDSDLNQYLYRWGIKHLTEILNEIAKGSLEPEKDLNNLEPLEQLKKLLEDKTFFLKKLQYQDLEDFFDDICEIFYLLDMEGNGEGLHDLKETTCRAVLELLFVHQVQGEGPLDISTTQALLVYRNDKRFYEDFLNYALQQEEDYLSKHPTKESKLFFVSLKEILAGLERRKENLDRALTLLHECKAQFYEMEDYKNLAKAEYEIGYIHYLKGNVELFQQVLTDSQNHSLQSEDYIGYHITRCVYHVFLANASIIPYKTLQNVLDEALPIFIKHEPRNENARRWVVNVYAHSIIAAYEENRQNDAISWFNKLETNEWVKKYGGQKYLYRYLARIYVLNKDYQKAKNILLQYLSIDKAIIKDVRRESLVQEYLVLAKVLKELNEPTELQNVIDICRTAEDGFANLYFKRRIHEIIE